MSAVRSYNVVRGDCLWNIARRNGVSLNALIRANPQIKNPDLIHPGQKIQIPGSVGSATGSAGVGSTGSSTPKSGGLSQIADTFTKAVTNLTGTLKEKMQKLLSIGKSVVGTLESGNNAGAITKFTGGKTGWPWCAKFVSWVYRQAGMPLPGGDQWAVAGIKSIIKKLGQWTDKHQLQPGMAVTFSKWSHVEIVAEPVYKSGKLVGYMTVGGNTTMPGSGREGVAHKFRSLSELEGGGYPVKV
ncbi:MAG: SafA/ExsA family spore coat assembly protein [Myxococcaceae bacterium]